MTVVTRFAPSPTGFLHIGNARTALFSWLYAHHTGGKFLLRIEDTDRERWSQAAVDAIHEGLDWLGIVPDGEVVYQFSRAERHRAVAQQLLSQGKAYHCYASQEELAALREQGKPYDRRWRDRKPEEAPAGVNPVIRLKSPLEGEVIVHDHVRGEIHVPAAQLEDLVILRSDGTPTYNLAVVVDDHDMGVTHVIRGEDHITNAAKQVLIYELMGWDVPEFAHVPLIHGPDGAKLSKRHGALSVRDYRDMGYLPEAMRNYLLRLGWAHGDAEIISSEQAVEWFDLDGIGKSASRFDFVKLENLNAYYIREADDARLVDLVMPLIRSKVTGVDVDAARKILTAGMSGLKQRAKTITELAENAAFYITPRPLPLNDKAKGLLNEEGKSVLKELVSLYEAADAWEEAGLQDMAKAYAERKGIKLGAVAQPLRAALSGSNISPGVFEVMRVLGKEESLNRIRDVL
ncbi:MAG TPA: glutamate--tRNA ligase [Rickettsiales bacterium]|nr:glutamate--tRNA ligase [Rickettsiales bacterium]